MGGGSVEGDVDRSSRPPSCDVAFVPARILPGYNTPRPSSRVRLIERPVCSLSQERARLSPALRAVCRSCPCTSSRLTTFNATPRSPIALPRRGHTCLPAGSLEPFRVICAESLCTHHTRASASGSGYITPRKPTPRRAAPTTALELALWNAHGATPVACSWANGPLLPASWV